MKVIYKILGVFIILFVLTNCKKDKVSDLSIDYSYFPSEAGKWIVYDIEQVIIDHPVGVYDTINYQIKEVIESKYTDGNDNEIMRIERYFRDSDTSFWVIKDVWIAQILNATAQKVEENIRYIKLAFPANVGKVWDGNAFNTHDYQEYEITDFSSSFLLNDIGFDSVFTITQAYDSSLIDKKYQIEKYARNIGMVYKYSIDIKSDISQFNPTLPIEERISTGTIYKQEAINYGE